MKSGSSAFMCSHGHSAVTISAASWSQKSPHGFISILAPVRLTTTTQSTPLAFSSAASTLAFSATFLPPRKPSSAVITTLDWQSLMRCARLSGEKPDSLAQRINDCQSKVVITADEGLRGGKKVALKANVDAALEKASGVDWVV